MSSNNSKSEQHELIENANKEGFLTSSKSLNENLIKPLFAKPEYGSNHTYGFFIPDFESVKGKQIGGYRFPFLFLETGMRGRGKTYDSSIPIQRASDASKGDEVGIYGKADLGSKNANHYGVLIPELSENQAKEIISFFDNKTIKTAYKTKKPIVNYGSIQGMDFNEYFLRFLQNLESEIPLKTRLYRYNWSIVKDYVVGFTSHGGSHSAIKFCKDLGINPDGFSFYPNKEVRECPNCGEKFYAIKGEDNNTKGFCEVCW